jgi:hypothetical protein
MVRGARFHRRHVADSRAMKERSELSAIRYPPSAIRFLRCGYHLAGKDPESRIEATVRDLAARVAPRVIAPGHCTGWRAKTRLAETSHRPGVMRRASPARSIVCGQKEADSGWRIVIEQTPKNGAGITLAEA